MAEVTEPYLREQLEKRRDELKQAIASPAAGVPPAAFLHLLHEVDSALERMDEGTFGICEACHDTIEKERLISDPLVRLCIDHLTSAEQRALEGDLELASRDSARPVAADRRAVSRLADHYQYNAGGLVSGDYCDLILPSGDDGKLIFLLGDVAGKGVAASLLMTHLHAMFRSLSAIGIELDKLLDVGNRIFCESTIRGAIRHVDLRPRGSERANSKSRAPDICRLFTWQRMAWSRSARTVCRWGCSQQRATRSSGCGWSREIACCSSPTEFRKRTTPREPNTAWSGSRSWRANSMGECRSSCWRRA